MAEHDNDQLPPQELAEACAAAMYERDLAVRHLGIQVLRMAPGEADLQMTISETMIQGHANCHGGYLFTLADSAFAYACNSYDEVCVALGCSIDYIAPGRLGDLLTARATQVSRSGRTGNYDVRIENQHGQLIAVFHGKSYKIRGSVRQQENQARDKGV
ncbi:hydroxyphenylacetyl-CoA thioesterase PaaI [Pseudomonas sp. MAP12]|uniref:Hydroxyphenylacetyl-CoA thioesterase PaaI n=1 Tax=Geopseudomonas aromaticivorans TaxID=2849492 RepID=A0ABS6N213_9GAMM|nr:hydroxyphenylacetyl-CoA thioesterase PaaI [Pseudomonas aromaticivorans]MBV2135080.1 hydroxyphenylacetyl-CoA thioesterase PaaI [Pseudomonas aromaticivorans]